MTKVLKRDGREVDFNKDRIIYAIKMAMLETTKGVNEDLVEKIADNIEKIEKSAITVEEIQDLVENKLMSSSRKDVAKEYITYRNNRTEIREKDKTLDKKIKDIFDCNNINNDNANINQSSFSGREQRVSDEIHKNYAMNNLLRDSVKKAFQENYIYEHDFNKYAVGEHNCLFLDFNNQLFVNGFSTRNGDVRKPNSIDSAFQQMAVAFQCQSQVQFGGVGTTHIDFDLAPMVAISFKKYFKDGLKWLINVDNPDTYIKENKIEDIKLDSEQLKEIYPKIYEYAYAHLEKEGIQGAESFYHNLNTLESRQGKMIAV